MLLAKTSDMAWRLRGMFKERQVVKRYWMITKGIPNPMSGVIDIPIVETEVGEQSHCQGPHHYLLGYNLLLFYYLVASCYFAALNSMISSYLVRIRGHITM